MTLFRSPALLAATALTAGVVAGAWAAHRQFVVFSQAAGQAGQTPPAQGGGRGRGQGTPTTIRAARAIDGRGNLLQPALITIQGGRITSVSATAGDTPATYDLGDVTLLPGLIDV